MDRPSFYCLAPDIVLENFGEKSVILLAERDKWITFDRPGADILSLILKNFGQKLFSMASLMKLLDRHYEIGMVPLEDINKVMLEWRECGILQKKGLCDQAVNFDWDENKAGPQ